MPFLPKQAADSSLRRARRFLELADQSLPVSRVKNDLRRMAVVLAVAAIDSYMHALVLRRLTDVRHAGDLPKRLKTLELPFGDMAELADAWIAFQQEQSSAVRESGRLISGRPWVRVKHALQRRLHKETFQSFDQVGMALSMAGVENGWKRISNEMNETPQQIKHWLSSLVQRRNQIVHEGDLRRQSRPQGLNFNPVTHAEIDKQIGQVERLIEAIDRVVS